MNNDFRQSQKQSQKQIQRMSQRQIQAVNFLAMDSKELSEEIYKFANDNPALEIVTDKKVSSENIQKSNDFQKVLEAQENYEESLQQHLLDQLKLEKISEEEFSVSQSLIYNLDKNGFYGTMLAPETFLDKTKPNQNREFLNRCIERIQRMDPIGTCCKSAEESLYVQAKIWGDATPLTLFILNGHLEMLDPPQPDKIYHNLLNFQKKWHSQKFASEIILDKISFDEEDVEESLQYILNLNPHPAGNYISDSSGFEANRPDIVLKVEKMEGSLTADDFSKGKVAGNNGVYFQIKYSSGDLPEIRLSSDFVYDKNATERAKVFIANLQYRESSIVLQGCAIVKFQKDFFEKGPDYLNPLSRRQIAELLGIHESTVSRMSSKKNSRYIQTEWGLFPVSYFFSSGISNQEGEKKISSTLIKAEIQKILEAADDGSPDGKTNLSDAKLTEILNQKGIKIARRTVSKYRNQCGIKNSYIRN